MNTLLLTSFISSFGLNVAFNKNFVLKRDFDYQHLLMIDYLFWQDIFWQLTFGRNECLNPNILLPPCWSAKRSLSETKTQMFSVLPLRQEKRISWGRKNVYPWGRNRYSIKAENKYFLETKKVLPWERTKYFLEPVKAFPWGWKKVFPWGKD